MCAANRSAPPRAPPAPWPRPAGPWQRLHLDYMSVGQKVYLVVIDAYSKWLECIEMTSGTTSRCLIAKLKQLFASFGLPLFLVSDNDAKIVSQEFITFCSENGIKHITSPIYHPCSNGQAENSVKTCKKMIKSILESSSNGPKEKLLDYLFEYRNTIHCTTGVTPAMLLLGRNLRGKLDLVVPPRSVNNNNNCDEPKSLPIIKKKCRSLKKEQRVWVRCYENRKPHWCKGIIIESLGKRMYLVKLENQKVTCKRHIDQLIAFKGDEKILDNDKNITQVTRPPSPSPSASSSDMSLPASPARATSLAPEEMLQNVESQSAENTRATPERSEVASETAGEVTGKTNEDGGDGSQEATSIPNSDNNITVAPSSTAAAEPGDPPSPPRRMRLRPRQKPFKL